MPYQFNGPTIQDYDLIVGDDAVEVSAPFEQFPCTYSQTYFLKVYKLNDIGQEILDQPTFIRQ